MVARLSRQSQTDAVIPDFRQTELLNAVEKLSGDLCISRPKSRLSWGIELPFDQRFRQLRLVRRANELHQLRRLRSEARQLSTINHRHSATNGRRCKSSAKTFLFRPTAFTGRSCCTRSDFPTSRCRQLLVHGWWNIGGAKMSKSVGQRHRSDRADREIRRRSAPVLFDERHRDWEGCGFF